MTREEAEELAEVLSKGVIPAEHRYRGTSNTLKVQEGWVRLGDTGIRAALVECTFMNWLPGAEPPDRVDVRVLVGNDWYYLDTEEKE